MKIAVIHDYADALRKTRAYDKLKGHEVVIHEFLGTLVYQSGGRSKWCISGGWKPKAVRSAS